MQKKFKVLGVLLLIFVLATASLVQAAPAVIEAKVIKHVDGDTVYVQIGKKTEKIRFIGVDTPESTIQHEPYGTEASNYTKKMLLGKKVYLQKDVQERDKYGRLLAYVWLKKPTTGSNSEATKYMFNAILVKNGYAQVMTIPPNVKYSSLFVSLQSQARAAHKGLWGLNVPNPSSKTPQTQTVYITKTGTKYHRDGCKYLIKSKIPISLKDAKAQGYEPCKVCNPPK